VETRSSPLRHAEHQGLLQRSLILACIWFQVYMRLVGPDGRDQTRLRFCQFERYALAGTQPREPVALEQRTW
jgi:hypothetical protein